MSTSTTRYLCPLDCGWHHDSADPTPTLPAPGVSIAEHAEKILTVEYATSETAVREHLESHPLIEWAREVVRLQCDLNTAVAKGEAPLPAPATRDLTAEERQDMGRSLAFAMQALQPGAEPVLCHHPDAIRSVRETMQAGWGRKVIRVVRCPACPAWAESAEGEPTLAPWVFNAERCTEACAEQHTNGPGCLMRPVWPGEALRTPATPTDAPVCPCCRSRDHTAPCTCDGADCCCPGRHAAVRG